MNFAFQWDGRPFGNPLLNGPKPPFNRDSLLSTVFFDPRFPAIGPHEGREAYLMRLGWKPAALFGDVESQPRTLEEIDVAELVTAGQFDVMTFTFPEYHGSAFPFFIRYALYFQKGRHDIVQKVQAALSWRTLSADSPTTNLEFTVGRALGYSDPDILSFVIHFERQSKWITA